MRLFLLTAVTSVLLIASPSENFGLGGETSSRVNGVVAEEQNPYAAFYNPALIAASERPQFAFTTSVAKTSFSSIQSGTRAVQLPAQSLTYWSMGFTYPFLLPPVSRSLGLGVSLNGPFHRLRNFNAHQPDDFFALRYGNSDSQFAATISGSVELWPEHLYFGTGVSFYISGGGNADATLSENPTGRMALDVGLESALVTGFVGKVERTRLGFSYHQELNPTFVQQLEARVPILGTTFRQPILVRSSLYYEPHRFELEGQHDFGNCKVSMGLAYQLWQQYTPPVLIVETQTLGGETRTTQLASPQLRNTVSPRASLTVPTVNRRWSFSGGYEFRPSPIASTADEANVLDSDTHILGLGIEHTVLPGEFIAGQMRFGLFGQYHRLSERDIAKNAREGRAASSYKFSGSSYTYGIYLQAEL